MKSVKIGLIGAGTVGSGLIQILNENHDIIGSRSGIDLRLTAVCNRSMDKIKHIQGPMLTTDYKEVVASKDVDVIVELIGGTTTAYDIVKSAILAGKTVITANKALISEKGDELFRLAAENNVEIGFEAAVGGAIPVIRTIKTSLVSETIHSAYGILNGTTNFILSKMETENLDYAEALGIAQKLGFAEADPTFDVEGVDAAQKVTILGSLAFNSKIEYDKMRVAGISSISKSDIELALSLGYRIKLLGSCRVINGKIDARVQPTMIPLNHPIASVMDEMNAIYLQTSWSGPVVLVGKGAGSLPTASAVFSDLLFYSSRLFCQSDIHENNLFSPSEYVNPDDLQVRYYLKFHTVDRPGVLAHLAEILGKHNVSISYVRQNESTTKSAEVAVLTHESSETEILGAVREIDKLDIIEKPTTLIRLEDRI